MAPRKSISRKVATSLVRKPTAKSYTGLVCKKHPKLKGLRYVCNKHCFGCTRDANKARRKLLGNAYFARAAVTHRAALRQEMLLAYGAKCARCGEADSDVLDVDHIAQNGAEHRNLLGRQSTSFARWLKQQGWPKGFRLLCRNCNWKVYLIHRRGAAK